MTVDAPSLELRWLGVARHELMEALAWYESRAAGLARQLLQEVRDAVAGIRSLPRSAPVARGDVRRKILLRFPYSILCSIEADHLLVGAFMHHRQRPGYWTDRRS